VISAPALLRAQAAYYVATGVWPVVDLKSFEAITGPKLEGWLVKTFGALVGAVGAGLWLAAQRPQPSREAKVVSIGSAAVLGASDVWYAAIKRRISPVYLADAAAQAVLLAGWAAARDDSGA
jgi:hypothetical protein